MLQAAQPDNGIEAIPWWWWGLSGLVILTALAIAIAWLTRQRPTR
jgi:hypothetical protein